MSRKHPQNGPSFSKATHKAKPLTDAELAERQAYLKGREAEALAQGQRAREWNARVRKAGGVIPLSGPGAATFWGFPSDDDEDSK